LVRSFSARLFNRRVRSRSRPLDGAEVVFTHIRARGATT
jgi:hypothetical protein